MPDRKYVLTKVSPGDWLLPGNDAETLWRLVQMDESEDGKLTWAVYKWVHPLNETTVGQVDLDDWDQWHLLESWMTTRKQAIDYVVACTDSSASSS